MTKIINDISVVSAEILSGNTVALPTETVYGLGANALNAEAVIKIFEAKHRPRFNPVIVHVKSVEEFEKYGENIPGAVYKLAEKFSPGPISYVVKKKKLIPYIVTAGSETVALRIPSHELFQKVLKETGVPICAPSANRFGKISPTTAEEVLKELDGKIRYILDGGRCSVGIESTVVSFIEEEVKILRHGYITREQIEEITGKTGVWNKPENISPGMLKIHYAPETPLYFVNDFEEIKKIKDRKIGILDFSKYRDNGETALNLFSDLRMLDEGGFDFIVCMKTDGIGIGAAINERLEKAGKGYLGK